MLFIEVSKKSQITVLARGIYFSRHLNYKYDGIEQWNILYAIRFLTSFKRFVYLFGTGGTFLWHRRFRILQNVTVYCTISSVNYSINKLRIYGKRICEQIRPAIKCRCWGNVSLATQLGKLSCINSKIVGTQ